MSPTTLDLVRLISVLSAFVCSSQSESFHGHVYHGVVKEDAVEGDNIELDSPLYVRKRNDLISEEICGYTIYKAPADLPFKMVLLEPLTGSAKIVIADGSHLDYERKKHYSFEISAHDCNAGANLSYSERELVLIHVEDVNDHRPEWSRVRYIAKADEGRIYDRLIRLEVTDADGSDAFSKICRYRIVTKNVPFEADANGFIHNTEPLNYLQKRKYVFEVTAEDCGGLVSEAATVSVDVNPVCVPRWMGIPNRVDFLAGSRSVPVVPNAQVNTCHSTCNLTQVDVTVKLDTSHVERDCDFDRESVESQLKLCGAAGRFIDLLALGSWNQNKSESEDLSEILEFNGVEDSLTISTEKFQPVLGAQFTLVFWMKHSEGSQTGFGKEQILCHSDGVAMNRHHYSISLHNCHLILLLRREFSGDLDASRFLPTEWRWKLDEVCDGMWHQYSISLDLQEVRLYVDGRRFVESRHNPMIIDDWPLHQVKFVHATKLVIGACWHGRDSRMAEYFRGELAGFSLLVNATESDQVLHCLRSCQEKLDFTRLDDMDSGTSVSLNSEMSLITISGLTLNSVQNLLRRITYVNTKAKPVTGPRPVSISTNTRCSNEDQLTVATTRVLLTVVEISQPILILRTSANHIVVHETQLKQGQKLFLNISLELARSDRHDHNSTNDKQMQEEGNSEILNQSKVDSCIIQVDSHMNQSFEYFQFPSGLFAQLGLTVDVSEDGLVVSGSDVLSSYETALSSIEYVSSKPALLNQRSFSLRCTEWTGQFISNQLDVTVEIVHTNRMVTAVPDAVGNQKFVHSAVHAIAKPTKAGSTSLNSREIGLGMAIMIVLCVGTLVILTVLGAIKLRTMHGQPSDVGVDDKAEMEWDNSALTITVNPMEHEIFDEPVDECSSHGNDTEESEEETTVHDNEAEHSDGEDEGAEKVVKRDLEWDDSTLTY